MGVFEHFPYTNFHDLNLDWIVQELEKLTTDVRDFISINAIKYANPIQWDITTQYEKNTVVLDKDGNAYLSVQPVPAGVSLDRTEYWTNIGNFSALWESVKDAITIPDEGHETTASEKRAVNDLVWVNGKLLEVTSTMIAGDSYVIGSNCRVYSMQIFLEETLAALQQEQTAREQAIQQEQTAREQAIQQEREAREQADSSMEQAIKKIKDQVYNVRFMGAKGDGVTNDTAIFKQLETVSGIVYIPNGTYYIADKIVINNCTIICESQEAILANHGDYEMLVLNNSHIIGGSFTDESVSTGTISVVDLKTGACSIKNANVTVKRSPHIGIGVYCKNAEIDMCVIDGSSVSSFGVHCDRENNDTSLTVKNCNIKNFYLNGIFSSALCGTYTNNIFTGNHKQTSPTGGGQIDVLSKGYDNIHYICNNSFAEPGGEATCAVETSNTRAIIDGNTIDNTGASIAIACQNSKKDIIKNNIIAFGYIGINLATGCAASIIDNIFKGTRGMCIKIESGTAAQGKSINGNFFPQNVSPITFSGNVRPAYFTFQNSGRIFEQGTADAIKIQLQDEAEAIQPGATFTIARGGNFGIYHVNRFGNVTTVFELSTVQVTYANGVLTITPTDSTDAFTVVTRID